MQYVKFSRSFTPFIFNLYCEIVCKFLIVGLRSFQIRTVDGIKDFSLIRNLHLGSTSFSLFLRLYPLTSDAMEVGIHLDIEDMIYYAFYKKLLIYVVYAFLLMFPSLFQIIMLPNVKISLALLLFLQLLVVFFLFCQNHIQNTHPTIRMHIPKAV